MLRLLSRRNVVAAVLVFFAALPFFANPYVIFIGNLALMYILLSVGLNMLLGYAGQLAFAHAALFGVGAYTTGLLKLELDLHYGLALVAGVGLATVTGLAVALPALRLRGLYLALATVAFAQATLWVFTHWNSVTYGGAGFRVPPLDFEPFTSRADIGIYALTYLFVLAGIPLGWNLLRSRVGRAWVAIRESEVAAESLAINVTRYKAIAYVVSAIYAGTAGGLFAGMLGIVTPESFDLFQVIVHFCMVIVGGLGSLWGGVIGAVALVGLQEVLRAFRHLQEIAFGGLLLFTVLVIPGGAVSLLKRYVPGWKEPLRRTENGRVRRFRSAEIDRSLHRTQSDG